MFEDGKLDDWQETFNLNVLALSVCSREAYKLMTKHKIDGHIIHVNRYPIYVNINYIICFKILKIVRKIVVKFRNLHCIQY